MTVPPGGATIVDFKIDRGGNYVLVDHALSRAERGLAGYLIVDGPENDDIMHAVRRTTPPSSRPAGAIPGWRPSSVRPLGAIARDTYHLVGRRL